MPNENTILNTIKNANKNIVAVDGILGVEIEVEGKNLPPPGFHLLWRADIDGSLKAAESLEYVMPMPRDLAGVKESLDVLGQAYKKYGTKVDNSIRAGVHVHLNVQQMLVKDFFTFLTCYYILEDALTTYCGPTREGNLFCLRSSDAEYILFELMKVAKEKNFKYLNTDNLRYATLNMLSLFKYGSVEFRAMRGTGKLDDIYDWCQIILALRDGAKQFKDPVDAIASMSGDGELLFLQRILGEQAKHFKNIPKIDQMIRQGARRAQMLAFCTDWNAYKDIKINPFK